MRFTIRDLLLIMALFAVSVAIVQLPFKTVVVVVWSEAFVAFYAWLFSRRLRIKVASVTAALAATIGFVIGPIAIHVTPSSLYDALLQWDMKTAQPADQLTATWTYMKSILQMSGFTGFVAGLLIARRRQFVENRGSPH